MARVRESIESQTAPSKSLPYSFACVVLVSGSVRLSGPVQAGSGLSSLSVSGLRVCKLGGGEFARSESVSQWTPEREDVCRVGRGTLTGFLQD